MQRQEPAIEHSLPCSLEELYKGSSRKMKISRTVHNAAGRPERTTEILSIDIKPGWKKGTKITFQEKGMVQVLDNVHVSLLQPPGAPCQPASVPLQLVQLQAIDE